MNLIKVEEGDIGSFTTQATLYRLTEPIDYTWMDETYTVEYVVLASSNGMFGGRGAAVFACNQNGDTCENMVKMASGGTPRQARFSFIEKYIERFDLDQYIIDDRQGDNGSV